MSRSLWFDHCYRLAHALNRSLSSMSPTQSSELIEKLQVRLTAPEYEQLALELSRLQPTYNEAPTTAPWRIAICGVAFVCDSEEYCSELRRKLHNAEIGRFNEANYWLGVIQSFGRSRVDRGVHIPQTNKPGTDRRGPT